MTTKELIFKGYEFSATYLPNMDIYIDNGYVNDITPTYYENAVDALEEFKAIIKKFTELADEIVILDTLYQYYFRENFSLTEYKYKRVFELGRFLWYISIDYSEFIAEVQNTLEKYL